MRKAPIKHHDPMGDELIISIVEAVYDFEHKETGDRAIQFWDNYYDSPFSVPKGVGLAALMTLINERFLERGIDQGTSRVQRAIRTTLGLKQVEEEA